MRIQFCVCLKSTDRTRFQKNILPQTLGDHASVCSVIPKKKSLYVDETAGSLKYHSLEYELAVMNPSIQ